MVTNISLLSITRRTDLDDYASRVFPRAAGVSLGLTTRTAPAGYSLDALNDSLISTTKEALHGRRERAVQFDVKMPSTITSLNVQQTFAADALFDKALEWLQQHDTPAKFYSVEVTGVTDVDSIRPGNTIHVNITAALDGTDVETIDDDFNIVSMNKRLEAGKILIYTLELSTIERQALTESAVMAQAYIGATRGAAGGGATTNTIINGDVSGILDRVEALEDATLIDHDHSGDTGDGGQISHAVLTNITASDHHAPVTAGDGITVTGQQVALDLADNHTWTGNQLFQGNNTYRNLIPEATDTYDLGSLSKWWRSSYISTINSTVFAQNVQQIIGGSFLIPKNTGTLPAVASADATIDFGKAMTENDHLLVKSLDTAGTAKTEYIKVGTLVSGTTYNVTRDEAGAHATDPAWPDGTPYAVLGQAGDGWISLDATTTPRMSMFQQGVNYNSQTEVVRLGDINGLGGISSTTWGAYFGAEDKAYMVIEPTNGLSIRTGDEATKLDGDGLSIGSGALTEATKTVKFYANDYIGDSIRQNSSSSTGYADLGAIYAIQGTAGFNIRAKAFNRYYALNWVEYAGTLKLMAEVKETSGETAPTILLEGNALTDGDHSITLDGGSHGVKIKGGEYTAIDTNLEMYSNKILSSAGLGCLVYNNANIAIASGSTSAWLTYNSEVRDDDSIHSTSSNTDRLTAQHAGWYYVFANVKWASNSTGVREVIISHSNGTNALQTEHSPTTADFHQNVSGLFYLAVNDYMRCRVYQNSGGSLNILYEANTSPLFGMVRIA